MTPPGTLPYTSCSVSVLSLFFYKYDADVSVLPPTLVRWTYQLTVVVCALLNFWTYNDVST